MAIADAFTKVLGRSPSKAEIDYFQKFINQGDLSELEVEQILGGLPEAQQTRLTQQGQQYGDMLAANDSNLLAKAYGQANSDFRRLGRADSSGLNSAYAGAAQNLGMNRQNALAQFYGQGLQGINQSYAGLGQGVQDRGYGLRDDRTKFDRDFSLAQYWYTRQSNDYQDQLNAQNRANRRGAILGLGGAALGAVAGGYGGSMLGPGFIGGGAKMGAGFGGQMGGIFR